LETECRMELGEIGHEVICLKAALLFASKCIDTLYTVPKVTRGRISLLGFHPRTDLFLGRIMLPIREGVSMSPKCSPAICKQMYKYTVPKGHRDHVAYQRGGFHAASQRPAQQLNPINLTTPARPP